MENTGVKRVFIAVPCLNKIDARFFKSFLAMMFHRIPNVEYTYSVTIDSLTYTARDTLAQAALDMGSDYVLWIDSDMVFPADSLERLLAHDKDMVTALYFKRRGDHAPVIYSGMDENGGVLTCSDYPRDGSLFKVWGCGFGMVLMKTEVIRRTVKETNGLAFHPFTNMTEDLSFCYRWNQAGGEIWCDGSLKLGHMGEREFTEEDWNGKDL